MKQIICTLLLLGSLKSMAQELFTVPADAEVFYNKAMPVIHVKYRKLVERTSARVKDTDITADSITKILNRSGIGVNLGIADIDALVMFVMIEVSKDAREDIKELIMEIKKNNAAKQTLRQPEIKQRPMVTDSLANDQHKLKDKRAGQSNNDASVDTGQQLEIRMKNIIARRTKINDMISVLMKKISDTQSQIIQNLK
jgi:hypothetical protein